MFRERLPKGTQARVVQGIHQEDPSYTAETVGVIEAWEEEPTGAWFAHDPEGRLSLQRLRLRKPDGEVSVLTIDDQTEVHRVEPDHRHTPEPSAPPRQEYAT
jgi:hypothetical protein